MGNSLPHFVHPGRNQRCVRIARHTTLGAAHHATCDTVEITAANDTG
jgi:hypothetical protein